ncbi:MAG: hypothetical protein ACXVIJ_11555 [Thermoanaerobaculia bacterium]
MTNAALKADQDTTKTNPKEMDEQALVAALLRGENDAWREYMDRYEPVLRHEAMKKLRPAMKKLLPSDCVEDVLADLRLDLLEANMRKIRYWADGNRAANFGSWLGLLVRQKAVDFIRRAECDLRLKRMPWLQHRDTDPTRGGEWIGMEKAASDDAPKKRRNRREKEEV